MKNFIQEGKTVTLYNAASTGITSGDLVVVGALVGVAAFDAASAEEVEIATEGVFSLPKVTTDVVSAGDLLYWDGTKLTVTPGSGSRPLVGIAVADAGNGVTTVECLLTMTGQTGPA